MKIAIVHYHLNRGGVTQVIMNHLRALSAVQGGSAAPLRVVVLYGGRREAWQDSVQRLDGLEVTLEVVPELEYDSAPDPRPDQLKRSLVAALARQGLTADETVLHMHNHALGKNTSLPRVVSDLARAGFGLLLQIHDFAEDFRPANYQALHAAHRPQSTGELASELYPQGAAIHYATLNGRDRKVMATAGVAAGQLHALPNPVHELPLGADRAAARDKLAQWCGLCRDASFVLYPVRGIRRKNVGEALLWAAALDDAVQLAVTLPPLNPLELARYQAWKQLADQLALPVLFDIGAVAGISLAENLAAADHVLTTSVAEGFGMVFLETWLADRPLLGRDLPEITADFVAAGVTFPGLSTELKIPWDWIDRSEFLGAWQQAYRAVLQAYGRTPPDSRTWAVEASELMGADTLDFARCSARLQELVVSQVVRDSGRAAVLRVLNPALAVRPPELWGRQIAENARCVRQHYSLASTGRRLQQLYQTVLDSPRGAVQPLPDGAAILDAFLSWRRFHPIRID